MNTIISLFSMSLTMATPLIFGVLGGLFTYKAGVLNIAIEGMMTSGAFGAILGIYYTRNIFLGCLIGIAFSLVVGVIFSIFSVSLKGHNVITGLATNTAAVSIAPFVCFQLFGNRTSIIVTDIVVPEQIALDIPLLRAIPIIGPIFNNQTPLTYFSLLAIVIASIILYKTKFGIYTRVSGENKEAAEAVGINVSLIRYGAIAMSALCSALAGINLAVENLGMYTDNMVSGRGFICLAAIYCGKGKPLQSVAYAFMFGFARALQIKITTYFDAATASLIEMLPYLLIVAVMFIAALGDMRNRNTRGFKNE
ncbi:MAG: ABC transporter permease [Oscillospiraceae bacterium]